MIIKKYANRRLYNTASSSYITLEDLARMVRRGMSIFRCSTPRAAMNITHSILTQIIMDERGERRADAAGSVSCAS